jgi:hypothetical protein
MPTTDVSLINPKISIVDNNATVTVKDNTAGTQVLITQAKAPDIVVKSPTVVSGDNTTVFGFVLPQEGQGTIISSNATGSNSPFIINMSNGDGDETVFQINSEGAIVLGENGSVTPAPTEGGIYYSNGVFYLGTT